MGGRDWGGCGASAVRTGTRCYNAHVRPVVADVSRWHSRWHGAAHETEDVEQHKKRVGTYTCAYAIAHACVCMAWTRRVRGMRMAVGQGPSVRAPSRHTRLKDRPGEVWNGLPRADASL